MSLLSSAFLLSIATPPLAAQPQHSSKLCKTTIEAIDAAVSKTMSQGSPGMIVEVASNGELLFSGSFGYADLEQRTPVTRDTVFKFASITKEFTAAAVLKLAEEGRLKLNDTLARHVPELPAAAKVRIYDLLVHSSGIPDYAEDVEGQKTKSVARMPEEMLAWIAELTPRLDFEPGSKWAYSNSNYALLGLIIERVSGQPLKEVFHERLFTPAGLVATAVDDPADVVPNRAEGYRRDKNAASGFRNADWISPTIPGPAGSLRGTASDLIRWKHALFGGQILKPASLKMMISAGVLADGRTTKFGMPIAMQKGWNSDYGLGVFIKPTKGGTRISHKGDIDGFSSWVAHYPASGVTIVQLINSESADLNVDDVEAAVFSTPAGDPCLNLRDDAGDAR